nr:hypothetical protein [Qipengyuania qiaonensis]
MLAFAPYIHTAPRGNSITPVLQRRFVATLAATGIVKVAARRIGKSLEALYKLKHRPGAEGFAAAWDAALDRGVTRLEDIAMERAMLGTRTPIVSSREIVGWWDKPDNALLRFLLSHRMAERYGPPRPRSEDEIRAEMEGEILAVARNIVAKERQTKMNDIHALINHMVDNQLDGRPRIAGIDLDKTLAENAAILRAREGGEQLDGWYRRSARKPGQEADKP